MNIQKHCIKNVEGSGQGKMIYLVFTDGYKELQIQNGRDKNRHGITTTTEAQNKRIIRKSGICTFKCIKLYIFSHLK